MGVNEMAKKKSGYLDNIQTELKSRGGLSPENKMYLRLKNGAWFSCPNCSCPKARRHGKHNGRVHCMNCGWLTRKSVVE